MSKNHTTKASIIAFSFVERDARVLRQVQYLSRQFRTTVIAYGSLNTPLDTAARMLPIHVPSRRSLARKARTLLLLPLGRILPNWAYETWYWGRAEHQVALALLLQSDPEMIHANDWDTLPVAIKAAEKAGVPVVLDLHEYAPLLKGDRWYWRTFYRPMIEYFLQKLALKATATVTVNAAIAERYAKEYGLRPTIVMNVPKVEKLPEFRPTDPGHIKLVHHGAAQRDRQLELMIHTLALTEARYTLHLMLVEHSPGYVADLKNLAARLASGRVFFHPPVRPAEVIERLADYDVGFYLLPLTNFNNQMALPNKFFDFVTTGLAVCIGPSPEMARLTQNFGFGVITPSFEPEDAAAVLNGLSSVDIDRMKSKALEARNQLNANTEMGKLLGLYDELLGNQ